MSGLAAFFRVGVLSGGGDVVVVEGFLDNLWVSFRLVEKVAAGMPQGMDRSRSIV